MIGILKKIFGPGKKVVSGAATESTQAQINIPVEKIEDVPIVETVLETKPEGLNEFSIREIMFQKQCCREKAIEILKILQRDKGYCSSPFSKLLHHLLK